MSKTKTKTLKLAVVGMLYRTDTTTLRRIEKHLPVPCWLVREPRNPNDKNAIAVRLDDPTFPDFKIGYIARDTAAKFAPRLDGKKIEISNAQLREMDPERGFGEMEISFHRL